MSKARNKKFLEKSLSSAMAAIEIYNKPNFDYREESFSILMIVSWELLVKAKLLKENGNNLNAITERDFRTKADGTKTIYKFNKVNRSGNPMTIGLTRGINLLQSSGKLTDSNLILNLELLQEVRDNSVHCINKDSKFSKTVQEIGTASLKNYMYLCSKWFKVDFTDYNFYLMPISFFGPSKVVEMAVPKRRDHQIRNFEKYVKETLKRTIADSSDEYSVALEMKVHFTKTSNNSAVGIRVTNDPNSPKVYLTEEDFSQRFPLDYCQLTDLLRKRYIDFSQNQKYHTLRKSFESNKSYCRIRLLNPRNPNSTCQKFFSQKIISQFDKEYNLRK